MFVVIRKIGDAEGVLIPKEVLDRYSLKIGDGLRLVEEENGLRLEKLDEDAEHERRMEAARECMDKYSVALSKLAKS